MSDVVLLIDRWVYKQLDGWIDVTLLQLVKLVQLVRFNALVKFVQLVSSVALVKLVR